MTASNEIMEMLNGNEKARKLKQAFEVHVKEMRLTKEQEEEERKTMIMLAMTLVPETIEMMGSEIHKELNK